MFIIRILFIFADQTYYYLMVSVDSLIVPYYISVAVFSNFWEK